MQILSRQESQQSKMDTDAEDAAEVVGIKVSALTLCNVDFFLENFLIVWIFASFWGERFVSAC